MVERWQPTMSFAFRIDRGVRRGSYRILATGPAGEALGRFKLPFSEMELENTILKPGSPRRGRRRIDSPEMGLVKSFGSKLFDAVFEGDVRELYRSSYADSREQRARAPGVVVADRRAGAPRGASGSTPLRPPELPVDLDLDTGRPLPRLAEATAAARDRAAAPVPRHDQRAERRRAD